MPEVEAVLARNLFDDGEPRIRCPILPDYLFAEAAKLGEQPLDAIVAGRLELELAA